jgi:hypothetical protein
MHQIKTDAFTEKEIIKPEAMKQQHLAMARRKKGFACPLSITKNSQFFFSIFSKRYFIWSHPIF